MNTSTPELVHFGRAAPTIAVTDVPRALAFYTGVLGFTETFRNGNRVGFVILTRDSAEIHLTRDPDHHATIQNVAHLLVDNAHGLYEHLIAHHVRIIKRIRDAPYGIRGFVLADPDGNRIDVGQPL